MSTVGWIVPLVAVVVLMRTLVLISYKPSTGLVKTAILLPNATEAVWFGLVYMMYVDNCPILRRGINNATSEVKSNRLMFG